MFDLLITGRTVVLPTEAVAVGIGLQDGRIVAIGAPGALVDEAVQTVDADGRIVTLGGIEPHIHKRLTMDDLHPRVYSPRAGWEILGWPDTVILRGKVMVDNRKLLGTLDDGQPVRRRIDPAVLQRPAF